MMVNAKFFVTTPRFYDNERETKCIAERWNDRASLISILLYIFIISSIFNERERETPR